MIFSFLPLKHVFLFSFLFLFLPLFLFTFFVICDRLSYIVKIIMSAFSSNLSARTARERAILVQ
jgi:hypothetical protein